MCDKNGINMKRFLLLCAFIGLLGVVKAQSGFVVGSKVGLNVTNISNSDGNNKASIHLGAFANTRLVEKLKLQVELLYSRQGYADKWRTDEGKVKAKCRVNYLNLPVMARYYVCKGLSVDLGPQFGFALNARAKMKMGSTTVKEKAQGLNTFDVSFGIGLSYELDEKVYVSTRYTLGMTNVFDKDIVGSNDKNRVFQFSVGYMFQL